ncbi:hypothetical protein KIPB_007840, partial [Kipferlia bialata]
ASEEDVARSYKWLRSGIMGLDKARAMTDADSSTRTVIVTKIVKHIPRLQSLAERLGMPVKMKPAVEEFVILLECYKALRMTQVEAERAVAYDALQCGLVTMRTVQGLSECSEEWSERITGLLMKYTPVLEALKGEVDNARCAHQSLSGALASALSTPLEASTGETGPQTDGSTNLAHASLEDPTPSALSESPLAVSVSDREGRVSSLSLETGLTDSTTPGTSPDDCGDPLLDSSARSLASQYQGTSPAEEKLGLLYETSESTGGETGYLQASRPEWSAFKRSLSSTTIECTCPAIPAAIVFASGCQGDFVTAGLLPLAQDVCESLSSLGYSSPSVERLAATLGECLTVQGDTLLQSVCRLVSPSNIDAELEALAHVRIEGVLRPSIVQLLQLLPLLSQPDADMRPLLNGWIAEEGTADTYSTLHQWQQLSRVGGELRCLRQNINRCILDLTKSHTAMTAVLRSYVGDMVSIASEVCSVIANAVLQAQCMDIEANVACAALFDAALHVPRVSLQDIQKGYLQQVQRGAAQRPLMVLVGDKGMGKTWSAMHLALSCLDQADSCVVPFFVSLRTGMGVHMQALFGTDTPEGVALRCRALYQSGKTPLLVLDGLDECAEGTAEGTMVWVDQFLKASVGEALLTITCVTSLWSRGDLSDYLTSRLFVDGSSAIKGATAIISPFSASDLDKARVCYGLNTATLPPELCGMCHRPSVFRLVSDYVCNNGIDPDTLVEESVTDCGVPDTLTASSVKSTAWCKEYAIKRSTVPGRTSKTSIGDIFVRLHGAVYTGELAGDTSGAPSSDGPWSVMVMGLHRWKNCCLLLQYCPESSKFICERIAGPDVDTSEGISIARVLDHVYVYGGREDPLCDSLHEYTISDKTWRVVTPEGSWPAPSLDHVLFGLSGSLYMVGGNSGGVHTRVNHTVVWRYDPYDSKWTRLSDAPYSQGALINPVVVGTTVHMISGKSHVTFSETDGWQQLSPSLQGRCRKSFRVGSEVVVHNTNGSFDAYNPEKCVWRRVCDSVFTSRSARIWTIAPDTLLVCGSQGVSTLSFSELENRPGITKPEADCVGVSGADRGCGSCDDISFVEFVAQCEENDVCIPSGEADGDPPRDIVCVRHDVHGGHSGSFAIYLGPVAADGQTPSEDNAPGDVKSFMVISPYGGNPRCSLWTYDPITSEFVEQQIEFPEFHRGNWETMSARIGDSVYLFGCSPSWRDVALYEYHIHTMGWKRVEQHGDWPTSASGHSVFSHGGKLYLVGGQEGGMQVERDFWCFDPADGMCRRLPDTPVATRYLISAGVVEHSVHLIGRTSSGVGVHVTFNEIDGWSQYTTTPIQVNVPSVALLGDELVVFGYRDGEVPEGVRVLRYNTVTQRWRRTRNLSVRHARALCKIDSRTLLLRGGVQEEFYVGTLGEPNTHEDLFDRSTVELLRRREESDSSEQVELTDSSFSSDSSEHSESPESPMRSTSARSCCCAM